MTPANESGLPLPEEPEPLQDNEPEAVADVADVEGLVEDRVEGRVEDLVEGRVDGRADGRVENREDGAGAGSALDSDGAPAAAPSAATAGPGTPAGPGSPGEAGPDTDTATLAAEAEAEAARERAAFDELVASFHSETAPDPVPRKIIRHPVLNTDPVWDQPIVEPTDETTVDKYFPNEHFEPPEPPPFPEASGATKASWTLLVGGVLFLVARTLLAWDTPPWTFWLAIGGVFGGIISLVARMRPDRDDDDDPDHGAVV